MAFYKQDIVDINLNTGSIFRSFLNHSIGFKNDDADRFGIRCFRDGEPVDLSGASCQAFFMRPDGSNLALTSYGTVSGNVAYVTLPQACYDYEGQFCLSIQLVGGGVTGTMRIVDGMVVNTGASGAVAPTASVPTYQEILAVYDSMLETLEDYQGVVDGQNTKIDELKSAFYNSIYRMSNIKDTLRKVNQFDDALYSGVRESTTSDVLIKMSGYSSVHVTGTIAAESSAFISRATITLDANKIYTMYVEHTDYTSRGGRLYLKVQGESDAKDSNNNKISYDLYRKDPLYFTPLQNYEKIYVNLFQSGQAATYDETFTVYILEGEHSISELHEELTVENIKTEYWKQKLRQFGDVTLYDSNRYINVFGNSITGSSLGASTAYVEINLTGSEAKIRNGNYANFPMYDNDFVDSAYFKRKIINNVVTKWLLYITNADQASYDYMELVIAKKIYNETTGLYETVKYLEIVFGSYCSIDLSDIIEDSETFALYIMSKNASYVGFDIRYDMYMQRETIEQEPNVSNNIIDRNMFADTVYLGERNGSSPTITLKNTGYSSVHVIGQITAENKTFISEAKMRLEANKTYTIYVDHSDYAPHGGRLYLQEQGADVVKDVDNANVGYDLNKIHVKQFKVSRDYSNVYVSLFQSGQDYTYDETFTIYILEGLYYPSDFYITKPLKLYNESVIYAPSYTVGLPCIKVTGAIADVTKENKVNITYEYSDRSLFVSGTGNIKWQGASSINYPKKNFTLNNLSPQLEFSDWGSRKKFVLKANFIDFSHARNICSAKLWKGVVRSRTVMNEDLYNLPNCGAIDGFPVMLYLNDEYHGLYTMNTSKDEGLFDMGDSATEFIFSAENHSAQTRFKELTTLADVEAENTFGVEYAPDEENIEWAITSLNTLIGACINTHDAEAYAALADYVDIDSAIDYMLFTILIGGNDNWDKNYLLATFDGTKWFFSVYDMDSTYGNHWTGTSYYNISTTPTYSSLTNYSSGHRLFYLIDRYDRDRVKARFTELINNAMSEMSVMNTFSNFLVGIPNELKNLDQQKWPTLPGTDTNNLAQILNWYRLRLAYISNEIENA